MVMRHTLVGQLFVHVDYGFAALSLVDEMIIWSSGLPWHVSCRWHHVSHGGSYIEGLLIV